MTKVAITGEGCVNETGGRNLTVWFSYGGGLFLEQREIYISIETFGFGQNPELENLVKHTVYSLGIK